MLYTIDRPLERVFVTADHHFGHENIIKFCDRPFATIEEMDEALIANWNEVIKPDDLVFHLGDVTLGDITVARKYLSRLNGRIHVLANHWHHDKRWLPKNYYGPITLDYPELSDLSHIIILPPMVVLEVPELARQNHPLAIVLCHYPLAVWDRKHYNAWHLHGHSHGNYTPPVDDLAIDVGVDCTNYYPVHLGGVLEWMFER